MPVTISKQKAGTFTLGATEFACQQKTITITPPEQSDDQPEEVLCGDVLPDDSKSIWKLEITAVQDFTDPDGFLKYTWDNDGTSVAFVWAPVATDGPSFTGTVLVSAAPVGGEVNRQLDSEISWTITSGKPIWTPAAPA